MKEPNTLPPVFPQSCGCPQPAPLPCVPRVPSVLPGYDLYESMLNLTNRVNLLIDTYNTTIGGAYSTLDNLYRAAQTNGSYYAPDEIWEENKFDATTNCQYTIIHKKAIDNCGNPIVCDLSFAFDDNQVTSGTEPINTESYEQIADKIFIAQPVSTSGPYGIIFNNGTYLKTGESSTNLWTVGFTACGEMKVYSNVTPVTQLQNDKIINSMGCPGVVIQYGELTESAYIQNIPNYNTSSARVLMGYNDVTRETLFMVVPQETGEATQPGMTTSQAAALFLKEGVTLAVEVIEGDSATILNAGMPYYVNNAYEWPSGSVFWFISKKCHYKNNLQRDVGELFQKYAANYTELLFAQKKIEILKNDLNALEQRVTTAEGEIDNLQSDLTALTNRVRTAETNITKLQGRMTTAENDIDTLQTNVTNLTSRVTSAEGDIDENTSNISANETAINKIVNGTTKLSYLKATSTTGTTAASSINMNNNDVTNLRTAPIYNVIANPYQKYAVSYENLAKVLPVYSYYSTNAEYPGTFTRYVFYGMLIYASGHYASGLVPSGSSVSLFLADTKQNAVADWAAAIYGKTFTNQTPAGPLQYTPGTILIDDGTVIPVQYWWRIGVSGGLAVGFDTISGESLPRENGFSFNTLLILDPENIS